MYGTNYLAITLGILVRTKQLVAAGWCQGASYRLQHGKQCYCLSGALAYAARGVGDEEGTARALLQKIIPTRYGLVGWNDTYGRTQQDVIDLIDKGISVAEGLMQGQPL